MVKFDNVKFSYHKKEVLSGISFDVNDGECLVIAGKNGIGKTTILKLLVGILKEYKGSIYIDGNIGYVPQGKALFDDMTVKDNLSFFYSIKNVKLPEVYPFSLDKYKNVKVKNLSGGITKIVSIACALVDEPKVILYDEPCANLDVLYIEEIKDIIKKQKEQNNVVIYVSHIYDEFIDFYDKLLFVEENNFNIYNKSELDKSKYISLFK